MVAAINYARKHLAPWGQSHMKELQQAMATLAFKKDTDCPNYRVSAHSEHMSVRTLRCSYIARSMSFSGAGSFRCPWVRLQGEANSARILALLDVPLLWPFHIAVLGLQKGRGQNSVPFLIVLLLNLSI